MVFLAWTVSTDSDGLGNGQTGHPCGSVLVGLPCTGTLLSVRSDRDSNGNFASATGSRHCQPPRNAHFVLFTFYNPRICTGVSCPDSCEQCWTAPADEVLVHSCQLSLFSANFVKRLIARWLAGSAVLPQARFDGTDGLESGQAARLGVALWKERPPA
jgi:hypothetical protein